MSHFGTGKDSKAQLWGQQIKFIQLTFLNSVNRILSVQDKHVKQ